ncbi:hypothetical protein PGTUg99_009526 [Puccinia graminis f. sp. tritici]|uniref:Uncharacterized protein n=1 Tax=Puccinia graminis f. sp. tritici TaxID=56615 RepID=A0A5B0QGJ0_PUCGR|nr:hypothetical protein PGTUg99_009526 [Puccinia graminis f. sp. tritici]
MSCLTFSLAIAQSRLSLEPHTHCSGELSDFLFVVIAIAIIHISSASRNANLKAQNFSEQRTCNLNSGAKRPLEKGGYPGVLCTRRSYQEY